MNGYRYVITYEADGDVTGIADIDLRDQIRDISDLPAAAAAIERRYDLRNVRITDYREER